MGNLPSFDQTQPVSPTQDHPSQDLPSFNQTHAAGEEALPSFDQTVESKDYGSTGQQALAGAEGAAKGFFPIAADVAEAGLSKLGVPGLSPEEQQARATANPVTHYATEAAGTGVGLLTGTGELGLLARGAEAAVGATRLAESVATSAKVASAAAKGLIEMAGLGASDEVSKMILGQTDPEAPVASALANIGVQGLLGAASGGLLSFAGTGANSGLKWLANTKQATAFNEFLTEFGDRWAFRNENGSAVNSIYKETQNMYDSAKSMISNIYGAGGLKNEEIERLTKNVNPGQISNHVTAVTKLFNSLPEEVRDSVAIKTPFEQWQKAVMQPSQLIEMPNAPGSAPDIFKATDQLKRQFQELGKYSKAQISIKEAPFVNAVRDVSSGLKNSLEDTSTWGDMGKLQADLNSAVKEHIDAFKQFRGKFLTKQGDGSYVVEPQKIETFLNKLGKQAGIEGEQYASPAAMKKYVAAYEGLKDSVNSAYAARGVESPMAPVSLNNIKDAFNQKTTGSSVADQIYDHLTQTIAPSIGTGVGGYLASHAINNSEGQHSEIAGTLGAVAGGLLGRALTPVADKTIGALLKKKAIPILLKQMQSGLLSPSAWGEAMDHAGNIQKGHAFMQNAVDSVFTGAKLGVSTSGAADAVKEKVKKFIHEAGLNQQTQNSLIKSQPKTSTTQGFAEGGLVEQPKVSSPTGDVTDSKLSHTYPEHAALMTQAKARVYSYLNSIQPREQAPALPFDKSHMDPAKERSYDRALNIATKPLSIIENIKKGNLEPEHVQHMKQMWPEVYGQLSKKLMDRMTSGRLKDDKMPPYHVRQSLGMFLGSPLDSSMTPAAIQAAQSVFASQKATAQAAPTKVKKGTSKLGEASKQLMTGPQAAESRQVSGKA